MDKPIVKDTGSFHFQHLPTSGVGVSYSPADADLPNYPWFDAVIDNKVVYRTAGGKTWIYKRFQKRRFELYFEDVSDDCAATMGSLALAGTKFRFRVLDGASTEHVGTYCYVGDDWVAPAQSYALCTFTFPMEEIE